MAKITIVFETNNAAFGEGELDRSMEIVAVLERMVHRVLDSGILPAPKDSNGNTIGTVTYEDEDIVRGR